MAKFELKQDIEAPVERVWSVITDPKTWGMWFPGIDEGSFGGPLRQGSQFRWRDNSNNGMGSVTRYELSKSLEVTVNEGGKSAIHRFTLHPKGGGLLGGARGTTLEYDMDTGGGMVDSFIHGGNAIDERKMKQALTQVEHTAEGK
jgi:uncharacterized protein YndB with AHSA1/START domain